MRYNGIDQRLAAATSRSPKHDHAEVAEQIQRAHYEEIVLTIPEGIRAEEVADLLDVKGVMDGQAFLALVRGGSPRDALGDYPWCPAAYHAGRLSVPRHLSAARPRGAGGSGPPDAGQLPGRVSRTNAGAGGEQRAAAWRR